MQYLIPSNIGHDKSPSFKSYMFSKTVISILQNLPNTEAAVQRSSWEKMLQKYAANLQENTHAEVRFQ